MQEIERKNCGCRNLPPISIPCKIVFPPPCLGNLACIHPSIHQFIPVIIERFISVLTPTPENLLGLGLVAPVLTVSEKEHEEGGSSSLFLSHSHQSQRSKFSPSTFTANHRRLLGLTTLLLASCFHGHNAYDIPSTCTGTVLQK